MTLSIKLSNYSKIFVICCIKIVKWSFVFLVCSVDCESKIIHLL